MEFASRNIGESFRLFGTERRTAATHKEQPVDRVPEWALPTVFREIGLNEDPVGTARRYGIESHQTETLCHRAYLRIATPALPDSTAESIRRLWDTLEAVDSQAIHMLGADYDRETYFRDEAAREAVFFEHVRRQS
jgi:hypothetical protein